MLAVPGRASRCPTPTPRPAPGPAPGRRDQDGYGARPPGSGRVGRMTTGSVHRNVTVRRIANGQFTITNARGGQIAFGNGETGCTAIDVDIVTSRRAEPDSFEVLVDAEKVRDEAGNHLTDIEVTFRIAFPRGTQGDEARAVLPDIVQRSHDRLCTVGRTVEIATPIATRIE